MKLEKERGDLAGVDSFAAWLAVGLACVPVRSRRGGCGRCSGVMLSSRLRTVPAPVGVVLAVVRSGMSRSVTSVPREGGGRRSTSGCSPRMAPSRIVCEVEPMLWRYGLPAESSVVSETTEPWLRCELGRWVRCCCRRCELIGRKKPWAASGTWVLLAPVVGRLWRPRLLEALSPLLRGGLVGSGGARD